MLRIKKQVVLVLMLCAVFVLTACNQTRRPMAQSGNTGESSLNAPIQSQDTDQSSVETDDKTEDDGQDNVNSTTGNDSETSTLTIRQELADSYNKYADEVGFGKQIESKFNGTIKMACNSGKTVEFTAAELSTLDGLLNKGAIITSDSVIYSDDRENWLDLDVDELKNNELYSIYSEFTSGVIRFGTFDVPVKDTDMARYWKAELTLYCDEYTGNGYTVKDIVDSGDYRVHHNVMDDKVGDIFDVTGTDIDPNDTLNQETVTKLFGSPSDIWFESDPYAGYAKIGLVYDFDEYSVVLYMTYSNNESGARESSCSDIYIMGKTARNIFEEQKVRSTSLEYVSSIARSIKLLQDGAYNVE